MHIFLFVSVYTLEIRVRAAEPRRESTIQLPQFKEAFQMPENCIEHTQKHTQNHTQKHADSLRCVVKTSIGGKYSLVFGRSKLVIDQGTTLILDGTNAIQLVAGTLWVQNRVTDSSEVVVQSEFGKASLNRGDFWVTRDSNRMVVSSIDSTAELLPRGASAAIAVPAGLENYLGRVGQNGEAQTGLPVAIFYKAHLRRWARLYDGSLDDFKNDVTNFQKRWSEASQQAAEIHKQMLSRKVVSLEAKHAAQVSHRKQIERRDRELRQLLHQRVFGVD